MLLVERDSTELRGSKGSLPLQPEDEVSRKLAMLIEGECEGLGATEAAAKYGYSRQRYYQVLRAYRQHGSAGLQSQKRGPRSRSRCNDEVIRQIIRHRVLDLEASGAVITQKLQQTGLQISKRSVERVLEQYGLQKKTP